MVKLVPRRWSLPRTLIAGVLAWLLALQGFAFAASPHAGFANVGAGAEQAISPDGEYCGAPKGGDQHAPGKYDHCQCCISRSSTDAGGIAWIAAIAIIGAVFPAPAAAGAIAWRFPGDGDKPPSGWTSSWSQRAPPRFF